MILGLVEHRAADGYQVFLDVGDTEINAQYLLHPLGSEEEPWRIGRLGPDINRLTGNGSSRRGLDDLDAAAQRVRATPAIDPALETMARLGREI